MSGTYDTGSRPGVWIEYADLPLPALHFTHTVHPKGSPIEILKALIFDTGFYEDPGTARRDWLARFGIIPTFRDPGGSTFARPLENWTARLFLLSPQTLELTLEWTEDDNVTAPNDHPDVLAMLSWLEELRLSASGYGIRRLDPRH